MFRKLCWFPLALNSYCDGTVWLVASTFHRPPFVGYSFGGNRKHGKWVESSSSKNVGIKVHSWAPCEPKLVFYWLRVRGFRTSSTIEFVWTTCCAALATLIESTWDQWTAVVSLQRIIIEQRWNRVELRFNKFPVSASLTFGDEADRTFPLSGTEMRWALNWMLGKMLINL